MPEPKRRIDVETAKRFIARFSSPEEAVRRLLVENGGYRDRIRKEPNENVADARIIEDLQRENDDLAGRIPKENEVIIAKADSELLVKYKALGTPEEVEKKVKDSGELSTKLADKDREEVVRTAAKAAGYAEAVLLDQVRSRGLTVEMRDQVVDGKTVKAPFVKKSDKDAAFEPLGTYVDRDLKDYLPALKASGQNGNQSTAQTGVLFPAQTPDASRAPAGDVADQFLAKRNERAAQRTNPLASPAATKTA